MDEAVRADLRQRVKDPADLPKFERFYDLVDKRLAKKTIPAGDVFATLDIIRPVWKSVFGFEWPKTRA